MGKGGVVLRVGHHDDGGALAVQFAQQLDDLGAVLRVEVTCGLVGEDELGVGHHGTGDGHTLLLSARELLGEVLRPMADGHALQDVVHALLAFGGTKPQIGQRQLHVLEDVQLVYQVEALEDEAYLALADAGAVLLVQVGHLLPQQTVAARGGVVQQAEDVQQGGLATTRGAHDGYEFALLYLEVHLVQCDGFYFRRAEYFAKVVDFDHNGIK